MLTIADPQIYYASPCTVLQSIGSICFNLELDCYWTRMAASSGKFAVGFPSSQHLCPGDDCSERPGDHCVYTGCSAEFWWSSAALARFSSFLLHKFILFNDIQCLVLLFHNILVLYKAVVYMAGWPRVVKVLLGSKVWFLLATRCARFRLHMAYSSLDGCARWVFLLVEQKEGP